MGTCSVEVCDACKIDFCLMSCSQLEGGNHKSTTFTLGLGVGLEVRVVRGEGGHATCILVAQNSLAEILQVDL